MNSINERDFSKSFNIKELRNIKYCDYLKYMKSNYIKKSYLQLLLASNNNISYHKNLIQHTQNIYTKYYYTKLLVQHAELIKKSINKIDELLGYLCKNTKKKTINNLKHDLLILYIFEYQSYKDALNVLSEIKIFYKNIHKYDIEDQIDTLNYKTNLAGIEYVKIKLEHNNKLTDAKKVEEIINNYKISHDDNILDKVKELEKLNNNVEEFNNISNTSNNSNKLILIFLIIIFMLFLISS